MSSRTDYKRLGDYIQPVDVRNRDLKVTKLLGLSVSKDFISSIANTIGTDMSTYKIVFCEQFVYIADTSRRGDKIAIALLQNEDRAIVSSIYTVFEVTDKRKLLPEYLMMWFRRPEFDRYARYKSHGSAREIFDWDEMCNVELPVPSIERQRELVAEYETITSRIRLNEQLCAKWEETAQTIYRKMFVDDIDPENLPEGWRWGTLGEVAEYRNEKIDIADLTELTYISTENMLKDKKGIVKINSLPEDGKVCKFYSDDVLLSNIRPYFKKIWKSSFQGGCSNDVLCIKPKNNISSDFLYYTMERNCFFDYVMAGSNGVKMPRGDKNWILNYHVPMVPENEHQIFLNQIAILSRNISINRQENQSLIKLQSLLLAKMGK